MAYPVHSGRKRLKMSSVANQNKEVWFYFAIARVTPLLAKKDRVHCFWPLTKNNHENMQQASSKNIFLFIYINLLLSFVLGYLCCVRSIIQNSHFCLLLLFFLNSNLFLRLRTKQKRPSSPVSSAIVGLHCKPLPRRHTIASTPAPLDPAAQFDLIIFF